MEPRIAKARALSWAKLLNEDWAVHHEFLTIDLTPFVRRVWDRLGELEAARKAVTSMPDILGGIPVLKGTRVPAHNVGAALASGRSSEEVLQIWPSLDAEKVKLAGIFADANPIRGRPRTSSSMPEGTVVLTNKRVARRKRVE